MRVFILATAVSIFFVSISSAEPREKNANINVFAGKMRLWNKSNTILDEYGIQLDYRRKGGSINYVVEILYSRSDKDQKGSEGEKQKNEITEYNLGLRYVWDFFEVWHPFIGGGLGLISAKEKITCIGGVDCDSYNVSNVTGGFWADLGFYFTFWDHWNMGIVVKGSDLLAPQASDSSCAVGATCETATSGGGHWGAFMGYQF